MYHHVRDIFIYINLLHTIINVQSSSLFVPINHHDYHILLIYNYLSFECFLLLKILPVKGKPYRRRAFLIHFFYILNEAIQGFIIIKCLKVKIV